MSTIEKIFTSPDDLLWTTIVAAVVSASVTYILKSLEIRKTAQVDYEYEQKKELNLLIGRYHGRLVGAASRLNNRIWNLYSNYDKDWITVDKKFDKSGYYFNSTVFRFMEFFCLIREIEKDAILLDNRVASKQDFLFINYMSAMNWIMADTNSLKLLNIDTIKQHDHFFSDNLRKYCDVCLEGGNFPNFEDFQSLIGNQSDLLGVLKFFDGISRDEERVRWDRLVCLHLLIASFLNSFGYDRHFTDRRKLGSILENFRFSGSARIFLSRLTHYDLKDDKYARHLVNVLVSYRKSYPEDSVLPVRQSASSQVGN